MLCFSVIIKASLLKTIEAVCPMHAANTKGVKQALSTSLTHLSYAHHFSCMHVHEASNSIGIQFQQSYCELASFMFHTFLIYTMSLIALVENS